VKHIARAPLDALTGARIVAALWVVLYHSATDFGIAHLFPQASGPELLTFGALIVEQGYLAVDFFFVLSGFILAYNYVTHDNEVRGGKTSFWIARFARIYPVYLLGVVLGVIEYLSDKHSAMAQVGTIGLHVVLLQSWIPAALPIDLNPPDWSLAAEAFFYALFPLLLPVFARFGRRIQIGLAAGSWIAYILTLIGLALLGHALGFSAGSPTWRTVSKFNPLPRLPEFLIGMALGIAFVRLHGLLNRTPPAPKPSNYRQVFSYDLGIMLLLVALGLVFLLETPVATGNPVTSVMALFALPLFSVLIYVLAFQQGLFARVLSLRPVMWLGEISYGIYILHWPLWSLWRKYVVSLMPFDIHSVWSLTVYLLIVVAAAGLSFKYLEVPTRRAVRAWWGKPKAAPIHVPEPVQAAQ
jgi:peptidoglycan/LPS O-acetylase OafA/YrhL